VKLVLACISLVFVGPFVGFYSPFFLVFALCHRMGPEEADIQKTQ
jgi:hypothetical protein